MVQKFSIAHEVQKAEWAIDSEAMRARGIMVLVKSIVGCCGLYESEEELCHWWKYGYMNL